MDEARDAELGTVCSLLTGQGHEEVAKRLAIAVTSVFTKPYEDRHTYDQVCTQIFLEVEPHQVSAFGDLELELIGEAYRKVWAADAIDSCFVTLVPRLVEGDWRGALLGQQRVASNQASLTGKEAPFVEDRMRFRSPAELKLYRVLRAKQVELPPDDTITILPNPTARVPGHSWEPDFVIAYHGRIGVIEVDGYHHASRAAADRTRDRLLEDGGFGRVDHITAEDAEGPEAQFFVERFLHRLRNSGS